MDTERVRPSPAGTGDSQVDAAIEGLASLTDHDLAEQPAVLEAVHDRLREILGELGDAPGQGQQGQQHGRQGQQHGQQGQQHGQQGQQHGQQGAPRPGEPVRPGQPGRRGEQGELGGGRRW
jgi:hypothetical protein